MFCTVNILNMTDLKIYDTWNISLCFLYDRLRFSNKATYFDPFIYNIHIYYFLKSLHVPWLAFEQKVICVEKSIMTAQMNYKVHVQDD